MLGHSELPVKFEILLVDDQRDPVKALQDALDLYLQHLNTVFTYHLTIAADKEDALREIKKKRFDIAIIDQRLDTGSEGIEVLEALLKKDPYSVGIMLTSFPDIELRKRAYELGAFDYITKFVNHEDELTVYGYAEIAARRTLNAIKVRTGALLAHKRIKDTTAKAVYRCTM